MNVILTYVSTSLILLCRHESVTNNSQKIISIHKYLNNIKHLNLMGFNIKSHQYKLLNIYKFHYIKPKLLGPHFGTQSSCG